MSLPGVRLGISPLDALGRAHRRAAAYRQCHRRDLRVGRHTSRTATTGCGPRSRPARAIPAGTAPAMSVTWTPPGRLWVEGRLAHVITAADGPITPVGAEQRIEAQAPVTGAALVGVGPQGTQQPLAVVMTAAPAASADWRTSELARAVRAAAERPLAAVLTVESLPVDIRHASKIDRSRLARWAGGVLSGARVGRP